MKAASPVVLIEVRTVLPLSNKLSNLGSLINLTAADIIKPSFLGRTVP